ncbi:MAG: alpha/beta hydrolase [Rhodospirillales bacterium]|nr:alpha/beta hydrolase [Rhodospirillales bacterium]MBO6786662.1 alpha/beta hydrolase [Rhodospirillales bacterium]
MPKDYLERRVTSQDGLSLYVRDYPGPADSPHTPLLCLGGLTRNSKDFAGVAKYHSRTRRVICPETRGRGHSDYDPDWQNYQPATYVNDVRHILCALGIHGVVVIGTSMGGIMGMAMAAAMPTVLKGLVLNDVGPTVRVDSLDKIIDYMKNPPSLTSWDAAGRHLRAAFEGEYPITEDEHWTRAATLSYVEKEDGTITFDWDANILKPILADKTDVHDLWHLFHATRRLPVLTVRGAKSTILDEPQLAEMSAQHEKMTSVVVPGIGHAPSLAEPASMEAINGFLEQF